MPDPDPEPEPAAEPAWAARITVLGAVALAAAAVRRPSGPSLFSFLLASGGDCADARRAARDRRLTAGGTWEVLLVLVEPGVRLCGRGAWQRERKEADGDGGGAAHVD